MIPVSRTSRILLRAAPALLMLTLPSESSAQEHPDSATAAIVAELERYYTDLTARDWAAFADHFWPGATLTTVWQPPGEPAPRVVPTTVPEFVAQAPLGPGSQPIFEERPLEIRIVARHGAMAQAWVHYEARFGSPGAVHAWRGYDAFTMLEHDGRWRIASLAYVQE